MTQPDRNFKWNFTFGVLNGSFFMAALAFLAGSTVLPVFISRLTESRVLLGLFAHMEWFGWLFPQMFAALFLAHREKVLGFYNGMSFVRLSLFGLAVAGIFVFHDHYAIILTAFGLFFASFALASGMAGVAFTEIVGKTIPLNKRGSFFGSRMFTGGLLAALGGLLVKKIISTYQFPYDFGYVCAIAWILMFLGLSCFALVKEPAAKDRLDRGGPAVQFKTAIAIFKGDPNFRQLVYSRWWINTALMASPFYVVFAMEKLRAPEWMAGVYLTAQMIGFLGSNLLWGWLSNRISNKMIIVSSSGLRIIPPLASFVCWHLPVDPLAYALVFVILGMTESGADMGFMTYILEISPEKGRVLSIGLFHTLIAPAVMFSVLGGWLSEILSLKWLFAAAFVTAIIAVLISSKLREPRLRPA